MATPKHGKRKATKQQRDKAAARKKAFLKDLISHGKEAKGFAIWELFFGGTKAPPQVDRGKHSESTAWSSRNERKAIARKQAQGPTPNTTLVKGKPTDLNRTPRKKVRGVQEPPSVEHMPHEEFKKTRPSPPPVPGKTRLVRRQFTGKKGVQVTELCEEPVLKYSKPDAVPVRRGGGRELHADRVVGTYYYSRKQKKMIKVERVPLSNLQRKEIREARRITTSHAA